jgi:hypothetical protein
MPALKYREEPILEFYRDKFASLNVVSQKDGTGLQRAAWMVNQCFALLDTAKIFKVNRWIGFVQCILWKEGIYTIEQLREHSVAHGLEG